MLKGALKWTLIVGTLMAVGPLASLPMLSLNDLQGGSAITFLANDSGLLSAALCLAAVFLAALLVGAIGAIAFSLNTGLACAGLVLAWGAWRQGDMESLLRVDASTSLLWKLAIEGALLGVLALALAAFLGRLAATRQKDPAGAPLPFIARASRDASPYPLMAAILAASLVGGAVGIFLVAQTALKGQAVAAAVIGGLCAGLAGQLAASQLKGAAGLALPLLAMLILAALGPSLATFLNDPGLRSAAYTNALVPLARLAPLDFAAGALLGVPVGLTWAGAHLDLRAVEAAPQT